jgi:antitoxin (DNA-binding transcriptional repressor) of toxin-antitoxin stability system
MARTNSKFKSKSKNYGIDLGNNVTIEPTSPIMPVNSDGAQYASSISSYFGATSITMDGNGQGDRDLLKRYRSMSQYEQIDMAIDAVVNEAIVYDSTTYPVSLNLDKLGVSKSIKMKIFEEFENVLKLLEFDLKSYTIFRRWYIDGRIYYNVIIDPKHPENGIIELRPVEAMKIKKIKEIHKEKDQNGVEFVKQVDEYYLYSDSGFVGSNTQPQNTCTQGIKFNVDAILTANSGIIDETTKQILSNLHKSIRPSNQLRMLEDAVVIYKITRAPERRIFYIDVGTLPKLKAEEHLRDCMNKYRNKTVYDGATGEVRDDKKFMTMLEDYWMPRREGGQGTKIDTLPGASAGFTDMIDVGYFSSALMHSLSVPMSRLQSQSGFNMGRSSEISRDEVNFIKFVYRLQKRFAFLFLDALKVQLILKGIISDEDWQYIKNNILVEYLHDNYFQELKDNEILSTRIQAAMALEPLIGKYFSHEYVRKHIFMQTDEDIADQDKMIMAEFENPIYYPPTSTGDELAGAPTDGGDEGGGGGSAKATGETTTVTLASMEHQMSKNMLAVQQGKIFNITKNGKTIAQVKPVTSESLTESYDVMKVSLIDSLENLLACMGNGEILTLSEGVDVKVNLIKF